MSKIMVMKIVTGEEIVARQISSTDSEVVIEKACNLVPQPLPNGGYGVAFHPVGWPMTIKKDKSWSLSKSFIIVSEEADAELEKAYLQRITGIKLAAAPTSGGPKGFVLP